MKHPTNRLSRRMINEKKKDRPNKVWRKRKEELKEQETKDELKDN